MVVIYFLWFYFVCSSYVALGQNFRAKAWETVLGGNHLVKVSTRQLLHILFVFTPPIGDMVIEVTSILQLEESLCVNKIKRGRT